MYHVEEGGYQTYKPSDKGPTSHWTIIQAGRWRVPRTKSYNRRWAEVGSDHNQVRGLSRSGFKPRIVPRWGSCDGGLRNGRPVGIELRGWSGQRNHVVSETHRKTRYSMWLRVRKCLFTCVTVSTKDLSNLFPFFRSVVPQPPGALND